MAPVRNLCMSSSQIFILQGLDTYRADVNCLSGAGPKILPLQFRKSHYSLLSPIRLPQRGGASRAAGQQDQR